MAIATAMFQIRPSTTGATSSTEPAIPTANQMPTTWPNAREGIRQQDIATVAAVPAMEYPGAIPHVPEMPTATSAPTSSTSGAQEITATMPNAGITPTVAAVTETSYPGALAPTLGSTSAHTPSTLTPTPTIPGVLRQEPPTGQVPAKAAAPVVSPPVAMPATQPDGESTPEGEVEVPPRVSMPATGDIETEA